MKTNITHTRIKELLYYNPDTGVILRRLDSYKQKEGHILDRISPSTGYITICLDNEIWQAHIAIFYYMTGRIPFEVDHADGVRHNNKWDNLAEVTRLENNKNQSLSVTNTSGIIGVSFCKTTGLWRASISINNKAVNLGRYRTIEEAALVRKQASIANNFHPNHGKPNNGYTTNIRK